ncbi:MAG: hypothetical protein FD165_612 [Gammaproteobacteria bacterium]|nr:MAG: hypothetical protein FD165_612 [Gammaproteobacteria bacterium]TND02126.1 MAG: hypothetical protein FD120_2290 [Gammaproteobacteria bacterium]
MANQSSINENDIAIVLTMAAICAFLLWLGMSMAG